MGCVPACGHNSNSGNVSCSQHGLHRQGVCPRYGRYVNGRSIKKCLIIPFGTQRHSKAIRHSKDRLNTDTNPPLLQKGPRREYNSTS